MAELELEARQSGPTAPRLKPLSSLGAGFGKRKGRGVHSGTEEKMFNTFGSKPVEGMGPTVE